MNSVEIYDPKTDTWTIGPTLTTPRRGCGLVAKDGLLFAIGGSDGTHCLCTTEIYDPASNSWSAGLPLPDFEDNDHFHLTAVNDDRLHVVGQAFKNSPIVFANAKDEFAADIATWGYVETREEYEFVLRDSDVVVSTANHEFFGIGIVEAMTHGVLPILPDRLSYPELLEPLRSEPCNSPNHRVPMEC